VLHKCLMRNIFKAEFDRELGLDEEIHDDLEGEDVGVGRSSDSQSVVGLGLICGSEKISMKRVDTCCAKAFESESESVICKSA
jgi:hypothetical protein